MSKRFSIIAFLPLIFILGLVILLGLRLTSGVDPHLVKTPQIGRIVPAIALPVLDTKTTQSLTGIQPPYIVNLFASWCAACRVEHPILMALSKTHSVKIIGIAYKDTPENTKKYLTKNGNPYDVVLSDTEGKVAIDLGMTGIPETFGVGTEHKIKTHLPGPFATMDDLRAIAKGAQ